MVIGYWLIGYQLMVSGQLLLVNGVKLLLK